MQRFKLLRSVYQGKDAEGKSHTYKASEPGNCIVESEEDLEKKFGTDKFQNLDRTSMSSARESELRTRIAELEAELSTRGPASTETEDLSKDEGFYDDNEEGVELPADLKYKTVEELRAFADESNIDLGDATKKSDILRIIRGV